MKRIYTLLFLTLSLSLQGAACERTGASSDEPLQTMISRALDVSHSQALFLYSGIKDKESLFPRTFEEGELKTGNYRWWTSGFFPGVLWQLYDIYREPDLKSAAEAMTARVEPAKMLTDTHDLGFMLGCSFGQGYRLTGKKEYLDVIMEGTESLLTRWNDRIGAMKSWESNSRWQYPVIIDNMMNLELLCLVSRETDNSKYVSIAKRHADTTIKNHFREDGSSFHVVSYDPLTGEPHAKNTAQGYSDSSAWARGQAWGLYGYTMMYRETQEPRYLEKARSIAHFLVSHPRLPEDKIPFWDFDAPDIPNEPRDASSAAIMASALLELSTLDPSDDARLWRDTAVCQLRSLCSPDYLAAPGTNGGFILMHSTGNLPGGSEVDVPLTYADYYFIEALLRLKAILDKSAGI